MARKPIDQLTDVELVEAAKKLGELTAHVQRDAKQFPGPGWDPVIDRLEEGWEKFDAETKRRAESK